MIIGAAVGFLLAVGILVIRYVIDDTLKTADDVERFLRLNTLAAVPEEGGTDNSEKKRRKRKVLGVRKGGHSK